MLRNSLEASLVGLEPVQGMYCHVTDGVCDVKSQLLSRVQLFVTSVDCSPPGSSVHGMEFSRQEYWSGLPFPSPGDLPNPKIKLASLVLTGGFFTTEPPGKSYS